MMEYSLGKNLSHSFSFLVDFLDTLDLWGLGGVLYINLNGTVKSFKVWEKDGDTAQIVPKFQFLTSQGVVVDLVLDNISSADDMSISAIVSIPWFFVFSGEDVSGIDGISAQFLVYFDVEIGSIKGSDGDDSIFLDQL